MRGGGAGDRLEEESRCERREGAGVREGRRSVRRKREQE